MSTGLTLGILAGGAGSRLGGVDKAWLLREGTPQVQRIANRWPGEVDAVLVSSNRPDPRFASLGLVTVADEPPSQGPLSGLLALAEAARTPWLLSVPVDVVGLNDCLPRTLLAAGGTGAFAADDDGAQPLVALWQVAGLREAATRAVQAGELAVHRLQQRLGMQPVRFAGLRFGNLNTPDDLQAAGAQVEPMARRGDGHRDA